MAKEQNRLETIENLLRISALEKTKPEFPEYASILGGIVLLMFQIVIFFGIYWKVMEMDLTIYYKLMLTLLLVFRLAIKLIIFAFVAHLFYYFYKLRKYNQKIKPLMEKTWQNQ